MNACILNTYVIAAAMKGIKLEKVEMETEGELDLRGRFYMEISGKTLATFSMNSSL